VLPTVDLDGCSSLPAYAETHKLMPEVIADVVTIPKEQRAVRLPALAANQKEPKRLIAVLIATLLQLEPVYTEMVHAAAKRYPNNGVIALLAAMDEGRRKQWDAAVKRLRAVDVSALPEEVREHLHHVRGLAAWHTGDIAAARTEWTRGIGGTRCPCEGLAELAGTHVGHGRQRTLIGRFAHAIGVADQKLADGDAQGAIAALDAPEFWIVKDGQLAARRALAWLRVDVAPGSVDELRRAIAFGVYREVIQPNEHHGTSILPVPEAFTDERIEEIDIEVARALGEVEEYSLVRHGAPRHGFYETEDLDVDEH
jgi:hypothetical protein